MKTTLGAPPDWVEAALCAQVDPELFFPQLGESAQPAKRVCANCDVLPECRAKAMREADLDGVWGGLTTRERRKLRNRSEPTGKE